MSGNEKRKVNVKLYLHSNQYFCVFHFRISSNFQHHFLIFYFQIRTFEHLFSSGRRSKEEESEEPNVRKKTKKRQEKNDFRFHYIC